MAQVVRAGNQQLISLELEADLVTRIARQAGFACTVSDTTRGLTVELTAESREGPLLLFDAADSTNLGWFSRCQFYVDGHTGAVLQTPMHLGNRRDARGRPLANSVRLQIAKELPVAFRMAGRQQINEQAVYSVFANLLTALVQTGVAVCGGSVVKPLAGRSEELLGRS
jgi:hypothetical protein